MRADLRRREEARSIFLSLKGLAASCVTGGGFRFHRGERFFFFFVRCEIQVGLKLKVSPEVRRVEGFLKFENSDRMFSRCVCLFYGGMYT